MKRLIRLIALALVWGAVLPAPSAESAAEAMHLLKTNCFSCHNREKKGGW